MLLLLLCGAYVQVGDAAKLQELLDAAVAAGVRPDQVMLTSLIKAAWKADAHGAAVDVFNALSRISSTGSRRGSSSSSAASSRGGSPAASMDGSGSNGSSGSSSDAGAGSEMRAGAAAGVGSTLSGRQQQQQQRVDLSQTLRAYACAAVADALQPQGIRSAADSGSASGAPFASAGAGTPEPTEQQRQQADLQRQLEQQLQQQMAQARQQPQQQVPDADPWSSEQPQQQRRSDGQLLLPLSAPTGPDSAAWNSLVAALVKAGQLDDAAAALERSTQASAAAGASRPPVEGYSALIRGYRRAGLKQKAVAALRQFLNLGGRPGRVMCDDVITLCLDGKDVKTARQVVRAMELTGSLDADSSSFYQGWFTRWEQQQQQQQMPRTQREAAASRGAGDLSRGSDGVDVPEQRQLPPDGSLSGTVAVERLKWWLGLPNSYYRYRGEGRGMCANEPYVEDDARQ